MEALVEEADDYALDAVFAFTYVADFFRKVGFEEVERGALPLKAWKDCLRCPKFQCCDEVAMLRVLRPERYHAWIGAACRRTFADADPGDWQDRYPQIGIPSSRKRLATQTKNFSTVLTEACV